MAIATGIPPGVWADEGEAAIVTAFQLLKANDKERTDDHGRQMSG